MPASRLPAGIDVSRETLDRLAVLEAELRRWQAVKNLVGPSTLGDIWERHIADSLQLLALAPDALRWADLGSGAGFPGLVIAIAGMERPGTSVQLVESNSRKCAFLRHVARLTGAPVVVHERRLEAAVPELAGTLDVVTARALASLDQLLAWTHPLLTTGVTALFPKGRDAAAELTEARKSWKFKETLIPSRTDPSASIVRIGGPIEPQTP